MKVITPGHKHELANFDGGHVQTLTYMQRIGEGYPGNREQHSGTNCQEVLRSLIERIRYLDNQIADQRNLAAIEHARAIIRLFEARAAERHYRKIPDFAAEVELMPTCAICGHIGCQERCGRCAV